VHDSIVKEKNRKELLVVLKKNGALNQAVSFLIGECSALRTHLDKHRHVAEI